MTRHWPDPSRATNNAEAVRDEDAQGEGQRRQPPVDYRRGGGKLHHFLADIIHRPLIERRQQRGAAVPLQRCAGQERRFGQARDRLVEGGTEHQRVEPGAHMVALARLAAPPGGDIGEDEIGAQHRARQLRQEGGERARFDHARARPVADHQPAARAGVIQVGDADPRLAVEGERIEEAAVHPAPEAIDALQPLDGAHEQAAFRHDQVVAFDQHQAEIAGEMRLFGIALVEAAGRQLADARVRSGAVGGEAPPQVGKEGREAPRVHRAQQVAGGARESEPVFERIAHAHGRAHPIGQHAPFAARPAPDVGGVEMEKMAARRGGAGHHAPIMRAAGDDAGRQLAIAHQRLGGIDVADDPFQQVRALDQAGFDMPPFGRADQQREGPERPGAFLFVAGQAEGEAKVRRLARDMVGKRRGIALRLSREPVEHRAPVSRHVGRGVGEQIPLRRGGEIGVGPA